MTKFVNAKQKSCNSLSKEERERKKMLKITVRLERAREKKEKANRKFLEKEEQKKRQSKRKEEMAKLMAKNSA